MSSLIFKLWIGHKLRRIILLHIGLVNCNFHFPKTKRSLNFHDVRIQWKDPWVPKPIILDFGPTKLFKQVQGTPNSF